MNVQKLTRPLLFAGIMLLLPLLTLCRPGRGERHAKIPQESIDRLDRTLENSAVFTARRQHSIDSLRRAAESQTDSAARWRTLLELSALYRPVNADSAVLTAQHAAEIMPSTATDRERLLGKLTFIQALSTSGLFYATLSRLDTLSSGNYPLDQKIDIWKTTRMAYSYAGSYAEGLDNYARQLTGRQNEATDSLLKYLPEDDTLRRFLYCSNLVDASNWDRAKTELTAFLREVPIDDNIHGMIAYQLAKVYRQQGDFDHYIAYLAEAAESDIQANVKEGLAMQELARWLYQQGDYVRANRYITSALNDATSGNARMRTTAISNIAPIIEATNRRELTASHNTMRIYAVTSTVLFIISAALAYIFLRNSRRIRANEKKLSSSTKKLEAYVGNFIALCSNYSSRLDSLTRLVGRKIAAGQTDDLVKMISSGKINEQDAEGFYSLVDKALLDLYPDFVENINTLLSPDRRIELKPGELLTPELRIYVFIRLGITQSTKIAQILHYSVNTVYTYRNRMRNRAIDRDNFDEQVANLGTKVNWIDYLPD